MEMYILNETLQRIQHVSEFETLIWTERWRRYGDFVLIIGLSEQAIFKIEQRFSLDRSSRVMVCKSIEIFTDQDDVQKLKISGRSLESITAERPNQSYAISTGSASDDRVLSGLPAAIARILFDNICRNNSEVPNDNIPFIQSGTISPASSIPEPSGSVEIRFGLEELYSSLTRITDTYNLGLRLIKDGDQSKLYFEIYTGDDHSIEQTSRPAVVFNSQLDAMTSSRALVSISEFKNVAYIFAQNGSKIVIADGTDPDVEGFDRRILIVQADDIDLPSGPSLDAALTQRGKEALAKTQVTHIFDCQNAKYVYETDYKLGDLVTQIDDAGVDTTMRVEEQTFISDIEGERDYPTLTANIN